MVAGTGVAVTVSSASVNSPLPPVMNVAKSVPLGKVASVTLA